MPKRMKWKKTSPVRGNFFARKEEVSVPNFYFSQFLVGRKVEGRNRIPY